MRRLLAYAIDTLTIAILTGIAVLAGELAGIDANYPGLFLVLSVLYVGFFPKLRSGATPGLFVVGLQVRSLSEAPATTYQLLLRAALLLLLLPAAMVALEFAFEYVLLLDPQMAPGMLAGWVAAFTCLVLTSIPFLATRCTMGLHDHVAGTCVVEKLRDKDLRVLPMKRLSNLVLVCIGLVAIAGVAAKIYAPHVQHRLQRTPEPELMAAREEALRALLIESEDLIDGIDRPFDYYADSHGVHGTRSWEEFSRELQRKGLLQLVQNHHEVPLYSIAVTTKGQLSIAAQDAMADNLVRFLRPRGHNAAVIEFISRTDLLQLITVHLTRRAVALDVARDTPAERQLVVLVYAPRIHVKVLTYGYPEELIRINEGK